MTGDEKTGGGIDPEAAADQLYPRGTKPWRAVVAYLEAFQQGKLEAETLSVTFQPFVDFGPDTGQGFTWVTYVQTDEYAVEIVPRSANLNEVTGKLSGGSSLLRTHSDAFEGSAKATVTLGKKDVASISGEGGGKWTEGDSAAVGGSTGWDRPSTRMYSDVVGELRLTLKSVNNREFVFPGSITLARVARVRTMSMIEVDD